MLQPKLKIIRELSAIDEVGGYLADKEYIAFDIETTGLTSQDEIIGVSVCASEDVAYYIVLAEWVVETQKLSYTGLAEPVKALLQQIKDKSLIMHNGVFDCRMVEAYFKLRIIDSLHTDTLPLAHLLNESRSNGLKDLASEYFGEDATAEQKEMKASVTANGGKLTKGCFELYKADPELIAKYGAKDAWLTYKLFLELVPELADQGLDKFFYDEETMPLLRGPTYDLNTVGLQTDTGQLTILKKTLQAECEEDKAFIYREIDRYIKEKYPGTNKKNTFNIGSNVQLSWLMFGRLELEFGTLTKEGKNVCKALGLRLPYSPSARREFIKTCLDRVGKIYQPEAKTLKGVKRAKKYKEPWCYIAADKVIQAKHAPRFRWIAKLLEYQRKQKLLKTYVEGIEKRLQYGVIRPSFLQHGTTSGRYASRNPNFQNLPRNDKRVKQCIVARPGKVFVGADYSQLEPRVFAYISGDKRLMEAFKGEDDFYSVIGMEVYGKYDCIPRKDGSPDAFGIKYKDLRDLSKVIALASTYGATANKLASTTGKNTQETQEDIDAYFERFPKVKEMMEESYAIAKREGQVTNIFGRPRRMPEAKKIEKLYGRQEHGELPYEIRNMLNLAVNHRIQSTGASIVNRAAIAFYKHLPNAGLEAKIVLQVHDSIVVECEEAQADDVALLLQHSMENTVHLEGIALEAIPRTGKNLSEV